ncbi:response regulator transcription factor [Lysinibacillus capsici]|uniref:Response regulator transcription factor n=1 Tax=Lysinibacillus capsici TaxID=2115968 RepID=A0ABY8KIE0_9BACI|nr:MULTISPECIES: response regulator transcription factor [Lysinibacillus]KMN41881.1 transcriptional regulator [Lysinibacillus sp. LK3]MCR6522757.1 response regulator transcription factor [Lysinibacillus capsici]MCT1538985.1 response regulator transcription factor [Lysinibacillus capsici]MCT1569798.1 response regulator transcription factor [Lysinibacillus capsici]MCT1647256.1 response regulator transcription factor [Lysinibacillus capsici]
MKKILLIEDEVSIAELQRDYLEINGFTVDIQHHGEDGLQQALKGNYDLIILDIMLPGISGFDICKQIRAVHNIPILFVSAKKEDIDKIRGLGLGADDYITKPFSPSELVARVKAHLSRYERLATHQQTNHMMSIHGITIDTSARKVFVNGEEIAFTTKEFDLLVFFVRHPNQVLSKEQLYERNWGYESAADVSTVTVHIRKLREKIEREPAHPKFLETVWGAGYRFNV